MKKLSIGSDIKLNIISTMYRFAEALDTNNFLQYRSCFANEVIIDYGDAIGYPPTKVNADEWTQYVRLCVEPLKTHHSFTNFLFEMETNTEVTVRFLHVSRHMLEEKKVENQYTQYGTYQVGFILIQDDWFIKRLCHRVSWLDGCTDLIEETEYFSNLERKLFLK